MTHFYIEHLNITFTNLRLIQGSHSVLEFKYVLEMYWNF